MKDKTDAGETLIELVVAILIMGTTGIVLASGLFAVSVNGRLQQDRSVAEALATQAGELVRAAAFVPCAGPQDYVSAVGSAPQGFTVEVVSVEGWSGSAFGTASTTLAADLDGSATTLQLEDPAAFGSAVPIQLEVLSPDPELVTVTDGLGTPQATVARGDRRSAHPAGAEVRRCDRLQRVTLRVLGSGGVTASVVVAKPGPLAPAVIAATAPASATVGTATLDDTVALSGGIAPTGTLTVELYAPADTGCTTPLATASAAVGGAGSYPVSLSPPGGFGVPGTYRWIARYSGDPANRGSVGACDAAAQRTVVGG